MTGCGQIQRFTFQIIQVAWTITEIRRRWFCGGAKTRCNREFSQETYLGMIASKHCFSMQLTDLARPRLNCCCRSNLSDRIWSVKLHAVYWSMNWHDRQAWQWAHATARLSRWFSAYSEWMYTATEVISSIAIDWCIYDDCRQFLPLVDRHRSQSLFLNGCTSSDEYADVTLGGKQTWREKS